MVHGHDSAELPLGLDEEQMSCPALPVLGEASSYEGVDYLLRGEAGEVLTAPRRCNVPHWEVASVRERG